MGDTELAVVVPSLLAALGAVPDPRHPRGIRYSVAALLTLAVCAMLAGSRSLYAIAQWGREYGGEAADVRAALGLTRPRTPSVATLFRVFRDLDRAALEAALGRWVASQGVAAGEALALDGKQLCGIHGEELPGIHLVAAYAQRTGVVLGQKGGA